jgi:ribosome-binding protein aMBF1 (putative translation factor)
MTGEEAVVAFGETAVWIECDACGRAYGGPSVNKAVVAVGEANVCVNCLRESAETTHDAAPQMITARRTQARQPPQSSFGQVD